MIENFSKINLTASIPDTVRLIVTDLPSSYGGTSRTSSRLHIEVVAENEGEVLRALFALHNNLRKAIDKAIEQDAPLRVADAPTHVEDANALLRDMLADSKHSPGRLIGRYRTRLKRVLREP